MHFLLFRDRTEVWEAPGNIGMQPSRARLLQRIQLGQARGMQLHVDLLPGYIKMSWASLAGYERAAQWGSQDP